MKVTCIMPTMPSRREWLPKAIECFRLQTYADRELVIVAEGGLEFTRFIVALLARAEVAATIVICREGESLGEKRNIASRQATGDVIAHWDDDDWSAPGRLGDQVQRLEESGKAVTGYSIMRFTDGVQWWRNVNNPSLFAFGTSLCYRRAWWASHPFPAIPLGEDAVFVNAAAREKQLIAVDAGDLMYATNHPGNTSKRTIGNGWDRVDPPAGSLALTAGV